MDNLELEENARSVRKRIFEFKTRTKFGHLASCLCCVDILVSLYRDSQTKFLQIWGRLMRASWTNIANQKAFYAYMLTNPSQVATSLVALWGMGLGMPPDMRLLPERMCTHWSEMQNFMRVLCGKR